MFERLSYKTKKGGKIKGLHHACSSAHVIIIAFFPGNKTRQLTAHARPKDNSGRVLTFNPHIMFDQIKDRELGDKHGDGDILRPWYCLSI